MSAMPDKRILFVTGTRADFGKLKSLIEKVNSLPGFEPDIFVTGMHMLSKYGMTSIEVERLGIKSTYKYINQNANDGMDIILAKTIAGLSDYVHEVKPDMIVVHGDRVEAMAGAIVGSLNNILVGHIEGGEVSGTIDELIRHAISKMAHTHFVCNEQARQRLIQLGELPSSIFVIGSPDLDVMGSAALPSLAQSKQKYGIEFERYAVLMYHPVTTALAQLPQNIHNTIQAALQSDDNFVVVYPNNDHGSDIILQELQQLKSHPRFRVFPSIRFEHFLTLLKHCDYMLGNSSAGVREAPYYGVPTVNLGSRQLNRAKAASIFHADEDVNAILAAIAQCKQGSFAMTSEFGDGNSAALFAEQLSNDSFWQINKQKVFVDTVATGT
jgi:UDP-N-acetylglucosamine 2-epimerase (hydrolysing)